MTALRTKSGVPVLSDFVSADGTPLVVDTDTGRGYVVTSGDVVAMLNSHDAFGVQTFADGDTTPSVINADVWLASNTGPTTITTLDNMPVGRPVTIIFTNGNTTLSEAGNMKLSAAFTSTADDTITLISDGTNIYETARSVN